MSGNNNSQFDKDAKDFITSLLKQHTLEQVTLDEQQDIDDDSTLGDASSNPSPATTADDEEQLEPPEDLQAMLAHIEAIHLAGELYDTLIDIPEEEMPQELAEAMINDANAPSPSNSVVTLISEVIEEQAALPQQHPAIRRLKNDYSLDTTVNGVRIRHRFDTLEQASLALIYAKLKAINADTSDHKREKAVEAFVALSNYSTEYADLYKNIETYINKNRANGVDIVEIVNDLIEKGKPKSSKRPRIA